MALDQQEHGSGTTQFGEEEWRNQLAEAHQLASATAVKPAKKTPLMPLLLLLVVALGAGGAFLVLRSASQPKASPNDTDDLGQGVNNASGLRGHLVTRWQKGKAQYQLKIEPIDPRANAGFALVTEVPPEPISINIRVLDSSGFALCGKEILLQFDPSRAAQAAAPLSKDKAEAERALAVQRLQTQNMTAEEQARESGNDVFRNIAGSDGKVEALWAEGSLPCSPDQYQRFDYWDLSTNFPTLAQQQALLDKKSGMIRAAAEEERVAAKKKAAAAAPKKAASAFYIEGDDHITAYEPARGLVTAGPGRSFFVDRKDQAIVADWAADSALIHYKCDQRGFCALRHGGSSAIVQGRMNE